MDRRIALVTGAGGEMGTLLVPRLAADGWAVVALDVHALPAALERHCAAVAQCDITDSSAVAALVQRHRPERIFHLAAILSAHAERDPERAHRVNVEGTFGLFRAAREIAAAPLRFLFPSSIAVYGLPNRQTKNEQGQVKEWQWTEPAGVYGCNKLYCELIGTNQSRSGGDGRPPALDFRAIRFPGLISAETLPTGGTTDYAPEMIHAAARGEAYTCLVREDTRLPFMTMPDAIDALLRLAEADAAALSRRVYNIRGFSSSAGEIRDEVRLHFPRASVRFAPDSTRQAIVDSWPADVDDSKARRDWGLAPRHGLAEALADYLVPSLGPRERAGSSPDRAPSDPARVSRG